jgi:hypothetical protein
MNSPLSIERDERIVSVENASYRWAYLLVSFGLLLDIIYRSTALKQSSWDLMALVLVGGAVATSYQGVNRVLTRRWAIVAITIMLAAAVIAATIVMTR